MAVFGPVWGHLVRRRITRRFEERARVLRVLFDAAFYLR
jgi:hypothetical protein